MKHDEQDDEETKTEEAPIFNTSSLFIHDLPHKTHAYYERIYKTSDRIYKLFSWIIYSSLFYFVYRETSSSFLGLISWVCYFILVTIVSLNISAYLLYLGSWLLIRIEGRHNPPKNQHFRRIGYGTLMLLSLAIIDSFLLTIIQHLIHHVQDIIHMQSSQNGAGGTLPQIPPP